MKCPDCVTVILQPDTTGYHIYSPNFPGCHSQGESEVEALRNFAEALEGWLKVEVEEELKSVEAVSPPASSRS